MGKVYLVKNDRIRDMGVGLSDKRERPKIWRVYTRRGKRNNENAEVAQGSGLCLREWNSVI